MHFTNYDSERKLGRHTRSCKMFPNLFSLVFYLWYCWAHFKYASITELSN